MRIRSFVVALALVLTASPALCQTVQDRLAKARTEINNTQNAASRALYAIDKAIEALTPPPTPTPTPTPAPDPNVPGGANDPLVGTAPGVGAAPIATTDHDVMDDLSAVSTNIPPSAAPDVLGAFRFICRHTNLAYDDPTVFYQQPGKSHLHDQTGVFGWNASSNYGLLRTAGGGSGCNDVAGNDKDISKLSHAANRTPYWQPALMGGKGNVILADYTAFYYKGRPFAGPLADPVVTDPANPKYQGKGVGLPFGLKFIFDASSGAKFTYGCTASSGKQIMSGVAFDVALQCAKDNHATQGAQFEVSTGAPDCWDGVHLDVPDHRSHLSYASYGSWGYRKCDAAHPFVILTFTYKAFYTILPTDDGDIHWSSDEADNTKPRGWSFHVDYGPMSWDSIVFQIILDNCINKMLNCSGGQLGNGQSLKGAAQPIYYANGVWTKSWSNPVRLVPAPPRP